MATATENVINNRLLEERRRTEATLDDNVFGTAAQSGSLQSQEGKRVGESLSYTGSEQGSEAYQLMIGPYRRFQRHIVTSGDYCPLRSKATARRLQVSSGWMDVPTLDELSITPEAAGFKPPVMYFHIDEGPELSRNLFGEDYQNIFASCYVDAIISPFDEIDEIAAAIGPSEIQKLEQLQRRDATQLKNRVEELSLITQEDPDSRVLSPDSVRIFRKFLEKNPTLSTPSLFVSDSGALRAMWSVSPREALTVLYQPDGTVEYVVFAPAVMRPTLLVDQAGSVEWQQLMPTLKLSCKLDWLFS
jgi:hypothetical protein